MSTLPFFHRCLQMHVNPDNESEMRRYIHVRIFSVTRFTLEKKILFCMYGCYK